MTDPGEPFDLSGIDVSQDPEHHAIVERFMAGLPGGEMELKGRIATDADFWMDATGQSPN